MTAFTINNILRRYNNEYPKEYENFLTSLKQELEKNEYRHYDLFGTLSIGLDTEITNELLLESCEKVIDKVLNDKPSHAEFHNFQSNNEIFKVLKEMRSEFDSESVDCCNLFGVNVIQTSSENNNIEFVEESQSISGAGRGYMFYNGMDDNNKKAMDIQATHGWNAAIKHMSTGSDGKPRTYAEMRELYG